MKRDVLLWRELLLEIESWETSLVSRPISIQGYTDDEVGYNLHLLVDSDLIEANDISTHGNQVHRYHPSRLTSEGHDWLDHARDEGRLRKAAKKVLKHGGALSAEIVGEVLEELARRRLGL